jgi:hypothetical protein
LVSIAELVAGEGFGRILLCEKGATIMAATNLIGERWLQCRLNKGMFSDEVATTYPAHGDIAWSEFVPAESVRGNLGETGVLRVKVVGKTGEKYAAVIPTPYSDLVFVNEQDLQDSP